MSDKNLKNLKNSKCLKAPEIVTLIMIVCLSFFGLGAVSEPSNLWLLWLSILMLIGMFLCMILFIPENDNVGIDNMCDRMKDIPSTITMGIIIVFLIMLLFIILACIETIFNIQI